MLDEIEVKLFLLNCVFFRSYLGDEEDSNGVNHSSDDSTQTHGYYHQR